MTNRHVSVPVVFAGLVLVFVFASAVLFPSYAAGSPAGWLIAASALALFTTMLAVAATAEAEP